MHCCFDDFKLPIVKKLLESNADVGAQRKNKSDATFIAAQEVNLDILKLVVAKDHKYVDRKGFQGRTPLGAAAMSGHLLVVQYLVNAWHVAIDSQDDVSWTALMLSAYFNHPTVVKFLLQKGASSNIKHKTSGKDAMAWATHKNNIEIIEMLQDRQRRWNRQSITKRNKIQ
jgi:ankyrin repeat protein